MIIKKLNITSFGALKNKELSFSPRLNVICGGNESGKTTAAAFIEAMLFGFPSRGGERKRYAPWGSESSSGSITLEEDGNEITVFRTFSSSAKKDEFKTLPPDASLSFLPKSRSAYRRSVYCRENSAAEFGSDEEITAKLTNLISTSDESLSAYRAAEELKNARRSLKAFRGSSGKISQIDAKLSDLEREREKCLERQRGENAREAEISEKEALLSELYLRREEYKAFDAENIYLEKELSALNQSIRTLEEKISLLPDLESKTSPPEISLFLPYIICSVLLFIISFALPSPFKFAFVLPVVICAAIYLFSFVKFKKRLKKAHCSSYDEYSAALAERAEDEKELKTLYARSASLLSRRRTKEGSFSETDDKIARLRDEISHLKASLQNGSAYTLDEIDSSVSYFSAKRAELSRTADALDCALRAVEYAKERLSRDFTPAITKKAGEYISLIAPKEGRDFYLGNDFSISITDGAPVEFESCSFGLKQEIYIAFRIALSDVLYGGNMPLIFDDPFLGSDEAREKKLLSLFSKLSENRQIIIFTNRKGSLFEHLDCKYIDMGAKNDV